MVDLKTRATLLERQAEAMSAQLEKLSQQITSLQTQLTDTETRRTEKERQLAERRAQSEQAVASLGAAQQQLATFNGKVGAALNYAAKASLANRDLGSARIYIGLAIAEAQTPRP